MTITFETLAVIMGALLVFTVALVVYLIRAWRRSRSAASPPQPRVSQNSLVEPVPSDRLSAAKPSAPVPQQTALKRSPAALEHVGPVQPAETNSESTDVLLMRVLEDVEGLMVVEAGGQRYRHLYDINDGTVGRLVLETIDRLAEFAKGQQSRATDAVRTAVSPPPLAPADEQRKFLTELTKTAPEAPDKTPRLSLEPVPFRRRSEAQKPGITLDLADEIERLLQVRLGASPEFSQRHIHISRAADGTLRFSVDGTSYEALEEIPDPEVQAVIRTAIADWDAGR